MATLASEQSPQDPRHWDRETWISALACVDAHGSNAMVVAAVQSLALAGTTDDAERARRSRVGLAVAEIQRAKRRPDEALN